MISHSQISTSTSEADDYNSAQSCQLARSQAQPHDIASSIDDKPVQSYIRNFQKTKISDKNCSSAVCWYQLYPFIEYSVQKDAIYCFRCRLFASQSGSADKVFTTNGFRNWKKVGEKSKKHSESVSHKDRMTKWTAYKQTKATSTVADQLLSQRAATIAAKIYYNSSKNSCFMCSTGNCCKET